MKEFKFKQHDYQVGGFTTPQQDMHGFDREVEDDLVQKCIHEVVEVFAKPNKFERRLAKHEKVPIESPATRSLYYNIIYADDPDYYCRGSGGIGGGKVFWTPYTSENEELSKKIKSDELCDNCKTLAHESQHGIGSNVEFDSFSDLPSIYNRLRNFPKGERFEWRIGILGSMLGSLCKDKFKESWQRSVRNKFCAIEERFPVAVDEILKEDGFADDYIQDILKCACGKETK